MICNHCQDIVFSIAFLLNLQFAFQLCKPRTQTFESLKFNLEKHIHHLLVHFVSFNNPMRSKWVYVDEDNIFNDCNRSASRSNCSLVTSYPCACHPQRGMGVGKVGVKGCAEIMGMKIIGLFVQCLQITKRREGKGQTLWLLITMLLSKQTTRLVQNCFRNVP